jgi:hypothetical protein
VGFSRNSGFHQSPLGPCRPGIVFINIGQVTGDVTGPLAVFGSTGSFHLGGWNLDPTFEADPTRITVRSDPPPAKSFHSARVGGQIRTWASDRAVGCTALVSEGWLLGAQAV